MESTEQFTARLFASFGPYVPLTAVWRVLSFPSLSAARRAMAGGHAPIPGISFPKRRGWYLRIGDLTAWYAQAMEASPLAPHPPTNSASPTPSHGGQT